MAKEDKNNKIIEDQNSSASSIKTKLEDETIKKDYSSLNDFRIEIRPIEDRKGVREYSKELEMVASKHVIAPYLQGGSNMFATGLNDDDLEYLAEQKCPYDLNPIYQEGKPSFWLSQMIKIEKLSKKYTGAQDYALKPLDLTIEPGKIIGFIGHNGAGKTTALKMMCGVLTPTSGDVTLNGYSITKDDIKAKQQFS